MRSEPLKFGNPSGVQVLCKPQDIEKIAAFYAFRFLSRLSGVALDGPFERLEKR